MTAFCALSAYIKAFGAGNIHLNSHSIHHLHSLNRLLLHNTMPASTGSYSVSPLMYATPSTGIC